MFELYCVGYVLDIEINIRYIKNIGVMKYVSLIFLVRF